MRLGNLLGQYTQSQANQKSHDCIGKCERTESVNPLQYCGLVGSGVRNPRKH